MNDHVATHRQLRTEPKRLRRQAGFTQRQAAEGLGWPPSKIVRIEAGAVAVDQPDLQALLDHYRVVDRRDVDQLVGLAEAPMGSFQGYRAILPADTVKYFYYEALASAVRQFEPIVIPGLLQTDSYARAVLEAHDIHGDQADQLVASRRERRSLFDRTEVPELFFIIDESVLNRLVGGRSVMRDQLMNLAELAAHPQVTIQVMPLSRGAHAGLRGPFVSLEFPSAYDPDVLYLENGLDGDRTIVDEPDLAGRFLERFLDMEEGASRPDDIGWQIDQALDLMRDGSGPPAQPAGAN